LTILIMPFAFGGPSGRDRMVVGFTTMPMHVLNYISISFLLLCFICVM